MVGPPGVMFGVGRGLTVTVVTAERPTHPLPSVTVTLYPPAALTVMDCVTSPFGDHTFPVPLVESKITLSPWQNVVELKAVTTGEGNGFTVTAVTAEVAAHPFASVTVTE